MAFITRFCAKNADRRCLRAALVGMLLAGCSQGDRHFGFSLERLESEEAGGVLNVVVYQKLGLSEEAKTALDHGVPLSIRTELALRPKGSRRDILQEHLDFEIRYLPLSNRYQLTTAQPFRVHTFPRLRHALAKLARVGFMLPAQPGAAGQYELRARSLLDKRHMPPPMRLPVWFSSQWQHDSGWHTWDLGQTMRPPGSYRNGRPSGG